MAPFALILAAPYRRVSAGGVRRAGRRAPVVARPAVLCGSPKAVAPAFTIARYRF